MYTRYLNISVGNLPYFSNNNIDTIGANSKTYFYVFVSPEDQLKRCRIEVSKDSNAFHKFADITVALKPGGTKHFFKNPGIYGSIVRIRNLDKARRALTLCEVKVYVKGRKRGITYL